MTTAVAWARHGQCVVQRTRLGAADMHHLHELRPRPRCGVQPSDRLRQRGIGGIVVDDDDFVVLRRPGLAGQRGRCCRNHLRRLAASGDFHRKDEPRCAGLRGVRRGAGDVRPRCEKGEPTSTPTCTARITPTTGVINGRVSRPGNSAARKAEVEQAIGGPGVVGSVHRPGGTAVRSLAASRGDRPPPRWSVVVFRHCIQIFAR